MPRIRGIDRSAYDIGTLVALSHSVIPFGTLVCDGSQQLISAYPKLYAKIGTTYGVAATGYFVLPDHRGRLVIGQGSGGGLTARTLGVPVGSETAAITAANLPSHSHSGSTTTSANGAHSHAYTHYNGYVSTSSFTPLSIVANGHPQSGSGGSHGHSTVPSDNAGVNTSESHDNIQPAMVATVVIAYA